MPVGGDVTITVTVVSNPDIRLTDENGNPATSVDLMFTTSNWNTAQTVTVQVAEDRDALLDSGTIRHVATGANFGGNAMDVEMRVNVLETTLAGVTIEPTRLTITEGLTGTYSVALQSEPESDVTVVLSSSNASKVSGVAGAADVHESERARSADCHGDGCAGCGCEQRELDGDAHVVGRHLRRCSDRRCDGYGRGGRDRRFVTRHRSCGARPAKAR